MKGRATQLALAVAAIASLSGCGSEPDAPKERLRPTRMKLDQVALGRDGARKLVAASWSRPGAWSVSTADTPEGRSPVAVARDRFGARVLLAGATGGYVIARVLPNCEKGTLGVVDAARTGADSEAPVALPREQAPSFRMDADAVKALCAESQSGTMGAPQAAALVRTARKAELDEARAHKPTFDIPKRSTEIAEATARARASGRPVMVVQDFPGRETPGPR